MLLILMIVFVMFAITPLAVSIGDTFIYEFCFGGGEVMPRGVALAVTPVTPDEEPEISWGPNDCSIPENMVATFSVVATGYPEPTFLWQVSVDNGSTWTDLAVTPVSIYNVATLTLEGKTTTDDGNQYRCVVTNSEGSVVSRAATLTVASGPSAFASVTSITDVTSFIRVDEPQTLSGTVVPDFATNKTIIWSIKDTLGSAAELNGDFLSSVTVGRVIVTATVVNGINASTDFTQDFFILIRHSQTPYITGPDSMELETGYAETTSERFISRGDPNPTVTIDIENPRITWNPSSEVLTIAPGLKAGVYPITFTASNGNAPDATHTFTLTVTGSDTPFGLPLAVLIAVPIVALAALACALILVLRKKEKPEA